MCCKLHSIHHWIISISVIVMYLFNFKDPFILFWYFESGNDNWKRQISLKTKVEEFQLNYEMTLHSQIQSSVYVRRDWPCVLLCRSNNKDVQLYLIKVCLCSLNLIDYLLTGTVFLYGKEVWKNTNIFTSVKMRYIYCMFPPNLFIFLCWVSFN